MDLHTFQLSLSAILFVAYFVLRWGLKEVLQVFGQRKQVPIIRVNHIFKYFKVILIISLLIALMMIWSIDYRGLLVFASSVLAVIGVALVAQWSILSNITAGVIVFFSFPARIGDTIEVIDGNSKIRGTIVEINIFQVLLRDENSQLIAYPNSLILQRPVIKITAANTTKSTETKKSLSTRLRNRQ